MVKQKLAITKTAIYKRIQRLPKIGMDGIENCAKGKAEALVTIFHDGIRKDTFGLVPLQEATISAKDARGYERPETPLYALGDEAEDTYANMMDVIKDTGARKWQVRPRDTYHQVLSKSGGIVKSKLKLKDLFMIHEYGCTIENGFGKGIFIRIPPRPALRYAYEKLMARIRRADPAKMVKEAVKRFVKNGNIDAMEEITKRDWVQGFAGAEKPKRIKT